MNALNIRSNTPHVQFLGAARSVSGSMHLVECGPYRLLLDCGLARGPREEARVRNRHFPFDPATIDAVILSHAHVDHCGNLPNLVRQGFAGPIYCTPATQQLIAVMLHDSARLQADDTHATSQMRQGAARGEESRKPLYTARHVNETIRQCVPVEYNEPIEVNPEVRLRFTDAGHILGSAVSTLDLQHTGRDFRLVFTGDVGRRGLPFLQEPPAIPAGDLVICESTYGGRVHDTLDTMAQRMSDIIHRVVQRDGKIFIPAFSLGRTQIVVHFLREWMSQGRMPLLPIYIDSPLAVEIAHVHEEFSEHLPHPDRREIPVEYMLSAEEARWRSLQPDPCILVASGGMCEGGRIIPHLRNHLDDPRSAVVLVSYQAPFSLGAQLLQKSPTVRFHGRTWNKWVDVEQINGFSGHADTNDFLALFGPSVGQTGRIRLVHGESEACEALATTLRGMGFPDVAPAEPEEVARVA
jgi:metallo-beta-lactamase family protein